MIAVLGKEAVGAPALPAGEPMFEIVREAAELSALAPEWDRLVRALPQPSPYLLHPWLVEWWDHFGHDDDALCILVARREGRLAAALPVCIRSKGGVRVLAFVGGNRTVLADLLLAPGEDPALATTLAQRAAGLDYHFADLFGLRQGSRLEAALGPRGMQFVERIEAPVLEVPTDWETVYKAKTSSRRRGLHRRRRRQLAALGRLSISVARSAEELERALEDAFVLHARRWQGRRDLSGFVTPDGMAFERAALRSLAPLDVPRIVTLSLDGRAVAFVYYFALEGRMFMHKLAFDPAYEPYSPGVVTLFEAISGAADEGLSVVEFLGGGERYKLELADRLDPVYEAVGLANGLLGAAARTARLGALQLRVHLRRSSAARSVYAAEYAVASHATALFRRGSPQ
jgi:CelD/BcsL family acetyltransferase involved in cellulose biosynthesis